MSRKTTVEVVGIADDNTIYTVFEKGGETIPNTLFRLQHPGMEEVEDWDNSIINNDSSGDVSLQTKTRTRNFFKKCVFPVDVGHSELEKKLIEKYGSNKSAKPNPETIPPRYHHIWRRVSRSFLDGSIWDEIPDRFFVVAENTGTKAGVPKKD